MKNTDSFRKVLKRYHDGDSLKDKELDVLHDHFFNLSELVKENPDLEAIKFYTYMHLNRINDYIFARRNK